MKILKLEPGKRPMVMEIDNSLESMQSVVGGMIQAVYPFSDTVALICNEEGKLMGLPCNRTLRQETDDQIYDIICGTCFLCGAPTDSDSFLDLTQEQLDRYMEYYKEPETFLNIDGNMIVLKMKG